MKKLFKEKMKESIASVLPITLIVLLLSVTLVPLETGVMVLFLFGAVLLIMGMCFFTLGVDMSMTPMGEGIGIQMSKAKHMIGPVVICFILGVIITLAEPDLQVLANQIPSVPNLVLIIAVSIGVGVFLVVALLRILFKIRLSVLLVVFYAIALVVSMFAPQDFVPAAFDSGGVTTGPITVPFIMAFGIGLATLRSDKDSGDDSFGLIALCSIGPILAVLLLGIFYNPEPAAQETSIVSVATTMEAMHAFRSETPHYLKEISLALLPIAVIFALFQMIYRRFHKAKLLKVVIGYLFTYVGLVIFLTGVNVGFMPTGQLIGERLAGGGFKYLLIPIGMIVGYFIVAAEPAVHVLKAQVEEISNGLISQSAIQYSLSIGVAFSVGLSMVRILFDLPLFLFLLPGYLIALTLSFFVPPIYTGVAFDSGGVASGPMTATFLLPLAMGACQAVGGNIMTNAFGIVAMVAMTPLITIQVLGFRAELKRKAVRRKLRRRLEAMEDTMVYYDDTNNEVNE
ncbi:hypothetical protein M2454_001569 [Aequitasia blattaphilus]|uniref:DUF1538 domain-containing protein n=1 Tax=Aequitasia blattaphilus TaxID=2949332 RepID=A0ABT1E6Z1_9FIRM|nr:DUF1538 domain-containing protein [Aequitasia blattaphilus]MCP1101596.1 DUF1538 domain-containing protein [Aequitasia blattaphilus]MCR8614236.1 DUF1538 domain-containing protein [Aequitasia blattaphilus]